MPKSDTLAGKISAVLNDPDLPEPLFEKFRNGMVEFFNECIDQQFVEQWERSPGYIELLLKGYEKERKEVEEEAR